MGVTLCSNSGHYMFNYIGVIYMKENFESASRIILNLSAAGLLITTGFCIGELSHAAITVLLTPDYYSTEVPTGELP